MLLSDPRVDPNEDPHALVISTNERLRLSKFRNELDKRWKDINRRHPPELAEERIANLLAISQRFDVDELQSNAVRDLYWSVRSHIKTKVQAYYRASGTQEGELLSRLRSAVSSYDKLLRVLIFKRPTSVYLIDWLGEHSLREREHSLREREQNDRDIDEAVTSVMTDTLPSTDAQPFRALILCLLYPTLDLTSSIAYLQQEGAEVQLSNILLSVWYAK